MPIHRHTSETVACLRGRVVDEFYDDAGVLVDAIELAPSSPIVAVKGGRYEAVEEEDILEVDMTPETKLPRNNTL